VPCLQEFGDSFSGRHYGTVAGTWVDRAGVDSKTSRHNEIRAPRFAKLACMPI
jgi:hypothetical protein